MCSHSCIPKVCSLSPKAPTCPRLLPAPRLVVWANSNCPHSTSSRRWTQPLLLIIPRTPRSTTASWTARPHESSTSHMLLRPLLFAKRNGHSNAVEGPRRPGLTTMYVKVPIDVYAWRLPFHAVTPMIPFLVQQTCSLSMCLRVSMPPRYVSSEPNPNQLLQPCAGLSSTVVSHFGGVGDIPHQCMSWQMAVLARSKLWTLSQNPQQRYAITYSYSVF